jgi:hypothetical protein
MTECELSKLIAGFHSAYDSMVTVYCFHWLKAKSRRDRWREEHILLQSMQWTELFFCDANSGQLKGSETTSNSELRSSKGHICYALKLESMLAQQAVLLFGAAKTEPRYGLQPFTRSAHHRDTYLLSSTQL